MKKRVNMRNKKGQITVFIIIAILLLFSTALVLFIREKVSRTVPTEAELIEEVPEELMPVRNFVTSCLQKVSKEAFYKLGLHGGYIDPRPEYSNYTGALFKVDSSGLNPTEAEAVKFSLTTDWYIPYWHHLASRNDASSYRFEGQIPRLTKEQEVRIYNKPGAYTIEEQAELYIDANLNDCLGQLSGFTEQGYDIETREDPRSTVIVGEKDVTVYLNYPIEVKREGKSGMLTEYITRLDLNFKQVFTLGSELYDIFLRANTFEQFTMNLLGAYGHLEGEIPPVAAFDMSFSQKSWMEDIVKQKIEMFLAINAQQIVVPGTLGAEPYAYPEDQVRQGVYLQMMLEPDNSYPEISADFNYLTHWPIYLHTGAKGGRITTTQSGKGMFIMNWLGMQQYNTPYDISYPMLVEVTDPNAYGGEGYKLYYMMETNLRNNEPINATFESAGDFAQDIADESPQICNLNNRFSGNITVEVIDTEGNPVPEAGVSYLVGGTECSIGSTELNAQDDAIYKGPFPVGIGAIKVVHQDYLGTGTFFPTSIDEGGEVKIRLQRIVDKPSTIQKLEYRKYSLPDGENKDLNKKTESQWYLNMNPKPLLEDEKAMIMLEKKKTNVYEDDFAIYGGFTGSEIAEIRIVPGNYSGTISMIREKDLTIPKCKDCAGTGTDKEDIQEAVFNESFSEGNTEFKNLVIDNNIYNENLNLVFRALTMNLHNVTQSKRMIKDLEMLTIITDKSADDKEVISLLRPKYTS